MDNKGVYCIENTKDGKKYVGSSQEIKKRKSRHFSELRNNKHKNKKLQNAYNKHGSDCFIFYIIEEIEDVNLLIEREQYYLDDLKPFYNINIIANSSLGVKRSDEMKEKVRQANLGLKHPEWRNKIKSEVQGGDNHWTTKKKFTDESKQKMSDSQKKLYEEGYKNPNSKKIAQYSIDGVFIKEWDSCYEAARFFNCHEMNIRNNVKGRSKTAKGFIWKKQ